MTDKPQTTEKDQDNADDPANPDFWHKVARMTVLDLVKAFVEFLEDKKNK